MATARRGTHSCVGPAAWPGCSAPPPARPRSPIRHRAAVLEALDTGRVLDDSVQRDVLADDDLSIPVLLWPELSAITQADSVLPWSGRPAIAPAPIASSQAADARGKGPGMRGRQGRDADEPARWNRAIACGEQEVRGRCGRQGSPSFSRGHQKRSTTSWLVSDSSHVPRPFWPSDHCRSASGAPALALGVSAADFDRIVEAHGDGRQLTA
jgi:hypothetical protein